MSERLTQRAGQDFEYQFCQESKCGLFGEPNGCNAPDLSCAAYCYFTTVAERLKEYEDVCFNDDGEEICTIQDVSALAKIMQANALIGYKEDAQ